MEAKKYLQGAKIINSVDFIRYLENHQHRIIDYQARQETGASVGSGAVESLIKQIASRVKIAGAQWEAKNVQNVKTSLCVPQWSTKLSL